MKLKPGDTVMVLMPHSKHLTNLREYKIEWISAGGYYAVRNDAGKIRAYHPRNFATPKPDNP